MGFIEDLFLDVEHYKNSTKLLEDNLPIYIIGLDQEEMYPFFRNKRFPVEKNLKFQKFVRQYSKEFENLYHVLEDDISRNFLREVLLFRMVGPLKFQLSTQTPQIKKLYEKLLKNAVPNISRTQSNIPHIGRLSFYDYKNESLKILTHDQFFFHMLVLGQYHLQTKDTLITVEKGDVVLDCGSEVGDSSLMFAYRAGESGFVYCFECSELNRKYLQFNLEANSKYKNIEIYAKAISNKSGEKITFTWEAGATRTDKLDSNEESTIEEAETITIDDFCEEKNLQKLDFIKMDIEGAERDALEGARKSIQRFKPKLAISGYHRDDDFFVLSNLILDIEPSYKLYIRHHSVHDNETVIYAICKI